MKRGPIALAVAAAGLSVPAMAADTFFQPRLEARTEYNSNLGLVPDPSISPVPQDVEGFFVDIGANMGVRTQRSDTRLQPKVSFQEYPDRDDLERANYFLGLQNYYQWLRSRWDLTGNFSYQDRAKQQWIEAEYDEFDPENPVVDDAGRLTIQHETITTVQLRPSFSHSLTQKVDIDLQGMWQQSALNRESSSADTDNESWQVQAGVGWRFRPLTRVLVAGYYAAYDSTSLGAKVNSTEGKGVSIDLDHRWSETYRGVLSVDVENTIVDSLNGASREEDTNTALSLELVREGQIDEWRFNAGRTFSPTNYGNRSNVSQIRVQYKRRLTPLLELSLAARGMKSTAQGASSNVDDDREYARGDIDLRWNFSRTWYVRGAYTYGWQKYVGEPEGSGHAVSLRFGYQGLPPQRYRAIR